jgi:hypothetical protein
VLPDPGDPVVIPPASASPDASPDIPDLPPVPDNPEVTLVVWPQEEALRRRLVAARRPRLLLVGPGHHPPGEVDELEDWMRFPLDAEELANRAASLAERARELPPRPIGLRLDAHGVLHAGDRWVALAPREVGVLAELLGRPAELVPREVLWRAAWPDGAPSDDRAFNGLNSVVKRLRRRIAPLGVTIVTLHGQGYLLDHVPEADGRPGC